MTPATLHRQLPFTVLGEDEEQQALNIRLLQH
jgi:hypothetical protein